MGGLGFFGTVAGGALEGLGVGIAKEGDRIAEEAKQLREEKIAQLRLEQAHGWDVEAATTAAGREDIRTKSQQDFLASQNALARENAGKLGDTLGNDEQGNQVIIHRDGTTTPVMAGGKQMKVPLKSSEDTKPSDQKMIEYLMGIGKTQEDALNWVHNNGGKSKEEQRSLFYHDGLVAGLSKEDAMANADYGIEEIYPSKAAGSEGAIDIVTGTRSKGAGKASVVPAGSGTQNAPFVGTTQGSVEWFKKYAKPGQYFRGTDGKLYKK